MTSNTNKKDRRKPAAWLSSMGDMLALMLTFFVLLFSMSALVNQEFISTRTVVEPSDVRRIANKFNYAYAINLQRNALKQPTRYIYKVISQHTKNTPGFENVKITLGKGWIIISVYNNLLFDDNIIRLSPSGKILLLDLIDLIEIYQNRMEIVSNVGLNPKISSNIDSRWILGLAYANIVRQYLFTNGMTREVEIGSRAWKTQEQISQAFSPEEREQLINRIEFVIYDVE